MLFSISSPLIAILLLALTLLATEGGFRLGTKVESHNEEIDRNIGVIQGSLLGLMTFLLGLSFAFAAGRFEVRHDLEQKEANALGTAYVRTELIQNPIGPQIRKLMPQYVDARFELYLSGLVDDAAFREKKAKADQLQGQIWQLDIELFKNDKNDLRTSLLTQSLNESFDAGGDVEESRQHRVPEVMLYLLFVSVVCSGGFVGYGFGRSGRRVAITWLIFAVLTTLVVMTILDLDRPERGFIRNSHRPLLSLRQSMK